MGQAEAALLCTQGSLNILSNVAAGDFRNCVSPVPLRHFYAISAWGCVGKAVGGDIAVFTAMCMCWSGYLSTHVSMMNSLGCNHLIGKAIISHTVGGLCAGVAAHWLYVLFALL